MKVLCCDICHGVVPLTNRLKSCSCKNVKGKYINWREATWTIETQGTGRCVGFHNDLRYGLIREAVCWVFKEDWDEDMAESKNLIVWANMTLGFYQFLYILSQICPALFKNPYKNKEIRSILKELRAHLED